MNNPDEIVSALAVATKKGRAKWFRDELADAVLCVLPNEIVRLTFQRGSKDASDPESMWLIVRGVLLLYLPGSDAGQVLLALAQEAADDHEALAIAKRTTLAEAMKVLNS